MSDGEKTRRERPTLSTGEPSTPYGALDEPTRTVDAAPDDEVLTKFPVDGWDRYEFVGFVGRGGMGAVFKARDPQLSRFVALKFLMRTAQDRARRFVAEARAQARVEHEHVCKVYEVGDAQGIPYIAMQFIDGVTLTRAQEQMTLEDKVHVMRKVADAVHAAHQGGLIHRDLKRSNVMVEKTEKGNWQPFVLDFGIARELDAGATIAGEVAGTPAYMAPEQAKGERVDHRCDLFALGVIAYELLAGALPFEGTGVDVIVSNITQEPPSIATRTGADVDPALEAFVRALMAREAADRFSTAHDALRALECIALAPEPAVEREDADITTTLRVGPQPRRTWGTFVAAAVGWLQR
jgi:serine/threonine-protein kinase